MCLFTVTRSSHRGGLCAENATWTRQRKKHKTFGKEYVQGQNIIGGKNIEVKFTGWQTEPSCSLLLLSLVAKGYEYVPTYRCPGDWTTHWVVPWVGFPLGPPVIRTYGNCQGALDKSVHLTSHTQRMWSKRNWWREAYGPDICCFPQSAVSSAPHLLITTWITLKHVYVQLPCHVSMTLVDDFTLSKYPFTRYIKKPSLLDISETTCMNMCGLKYKVCWAAVSQSTALLAMYSRKYTV